MGKKLDDRWNLSDLQINFCKEYVVDYVGQHAAQRAGYSGSSEVLKAQGSKLLKQAKIQSYIAHLENNKQVASYINNQRILAEYSRLAFSDVTNVLSFDAHGVELKDSKELTPDVTASIKEITVITTVSPDGYTKTTVKLGLYDKTKALRDLAQYLGMFNDFNNAIACIEKYGLSVFQDDKGKWVVVDNNIHGRIQNYDEVTKAILKEAGVEVSHTTSSSDS